MKEGRRASTLHRTTADRTRYPTLAKHGCTVIATIGQQSTMQHGNQSIWASCRRRFPAAAPARARILSTPYPRLILVRLLDLQQENWR